MPLVMQPGPEITCLCEPQDVRHIDTMLGCRTRLQQAEELTGKLTEEQKEEFAALEEHGSTAEQVRRRLGCRRTVPVCPPVDHLC